MSTEQQSTAELIDKPTDTTEAIAVPAEWEKDFKSINDLLTTMESWKLMTIEKDGITKVTANRVAAKKLRIRIEDLRKELGRAIMLRKSNVDAFADKLKVAVSAVETALEVIEDAHKAKVRAAAQQREEEAAKILNERIAQLESYGYIPADVAAIGKMSSPDFLSLLNDRRRIFERDQETKRRMDVIREIRPIAITEDCDIEGTLQQMSSNEFAEFCEQQRILEDIAQRERAEAEQAERDRVAKLVAELQESRQRVAELEQTQTPIPIVNSNGDTMPPQLGEVIDAEFEVIQPGQSILLEPGHNVQAVGDTVEISVDLRIDDSQLYRIGNELDLSADAFRMFNHLGELEISAVFRIEKKTGVGTLIRVNGLDVDRPF